MSSQRSNLKSRSTVQESEAIALDRSMILEEWSIRFDEGGRIIFCRTETFTFEDLVAIGADESHKHLILLALEGSE